MQQDEVTAKTANDTTTMMEAARRTNDTTTMMDADAVAKAKAAAVAKAEADADAVARAQQKNLEQKMATNLAASMQDDITAKMKADLAATIEANAAARTQAAAATKTTNTMAARMPVDLNERMQADIASKSAGMQANAAASTQADAATKTTNTMTATRTRAPGAVNQPVNTPENAPVEGPVRTRNMAVAMMEAAKTQADATATTTNTMTATRTRAPGAVNQPVNTPENAPVVGPVRTKNTALALMEVGKTPADIAAMMPAVPLIREKPFVPLTDAELMEMDIPALQAYSDEVTAVIDAQASNVAAARVVQAQYDYLIFTSQSTINGLGYEITTNSNLIVSADVRSNELATSNAILDSTIVLYNSSIIGNNAIITAADKQLSTLVIESDILASSLVQSDINFASSATYYSSLYTVFVGKDIAYQRCVADIKNTSTLLSNAIVVQKKSYDNWQTSSAYTIARSAELSSLYLASNAIQSSLTQYKINEINATKNLMSTTDGIKTVSSLYETSLVNQRYYQSLSTQGGILDLYTAAYSTFETATTLSNLSPGNTVVTTAAKMAQQRLSTLTLAKAEITAQTTSLQGLVAGSVKDTYATQLETAQAAVQLEIKNINTFQAYANSSIAAVSYYSSLYETANTQVISSMAAVKLFSSLYESSVIGSNAFMKLANDDIASIASQQAMVDGISHSLSSLNKEYDGYVSSYNGWISYSSMMDKEVAKSEADLITYNRLYESTNTAIAEYTGILTEVRKKINVNNTTMRSQSTILETETINSLTYENQIATSFNLEEQSAFEYRETFVRLKRQSAQQYYDGCVLAQVQATSTQNGNLKTQAVGSTVTPIAININTATINNAYTILTNISAFLDSFNSIYTNYRTQTSNLQNVSTSIGAQATALPRVTSAADAFAVDPGQGPSFSNVQADFISKQAATQQLKTNVTLTQGQINNAKITFLQSYNQTFLSGEIFNNESTISSFLRQGFDSAVII